MTISIPETMRLPDFILANIEPILVEWEAFARTIPHCADMDQLTLRDHAEDILRATVRDMQTAQTPEQQKLKSEGEGEDHAASRRLDLASDEHAATRIVSGFDMVEVVSEYRALRASVLRLWRQSLPRAHTTDVEDLTRFNESIDQSLAKAVRSYTERVDRAREMFLAILGHDLRNPLNAMVMAARVIEVASVDNGAVTAAVERIVRSADVITRMTNDLLDYTTTRLGKGMQITRQPMDLGVLCEEVVEEYRGTHPGRVLQYHPSGELHGKWDAARLRQAVSNLLANALQHGDADKPVRLRVESHNGEIMIAIRNHGAVIPPEIIPTLFNPLVRGPARESHGDGDSGHGFGLGLYIARQVVLAHGGRIDVQSSEADGTVFTIHLPRETAVTSA